MHLAVPPCCSPPPPAQGFRFNGLLARGPVSRYTRARCDQLKGYTLLLRLTAAHTPASPGMWNAPELDPAPGGVELPEPPVPGRAREESLSIHFPSSRCQLDSRLSNRQPPRRHRNGRVLPAGGEPRETHGAQRDRETAPSG